MTITNSSTSETWSTDPAYWWENDIVALPDSSGGIVTLDNGGESAGVIYYLDSGGNNRGLGFSITDDSVSLAIKSGESYTFSGDFTSANCGGGAFACIIEASSDFVWIEGTVDGLDGSSGPATDYPTFGLSLGVSHITLKNFTLTGTLNYAISIGGGEGGRIKMLIYPKSAVVSSQRKFPKVLTM